MPESLQVESKGAQREITKCLLLTGFAVSRGKGNSSISGFPALLGMKDTLTLYIAPKVTVSARPV
jgi:Holliday junction resolvase